MAKAGSFRDVRSPAFGDLLRRHRAAAKLTQEELAARSGLSPAAISALERGVRRAPRAGTVGLLAGDNVSAAHDRRELEAAAREGRQAEQAPPLEPRAGIPPDPIARFVGRDHELAELRRLLRSTGRVAIHGLGGVGKTQLAVRYLHQHRAEYPDGVFWVRADDEVDLLFDLASLAWHLALPEREKPHLERRAEAVVRRLRESRRWLLVLDNVEPDALDALDRWLPPGLAGHLLVTSRTPMWPARLGLEPLPSDDACELLLTTTNQRDAGAAAAVAEALGCLPLALSQAAGYLEASGRDLASYAGLLRTRLVELMSEAAPQDYPRPVVTTLRISLARLAAERRQAIDLLYLCAFLAPDDIPIGLVQGGAALLPEALRDVLDDELELDRTIAVLRRYSLVERGGDSLRVHRLVQAVIRETISRDLRATWLGRTICLLASALPDKLCEHTRNWDFYARLLPHVVFLESLPAAASVEPLALSRMLGRAGEYAHARADFEMAGRLLCRALAIREHELGPDHPDTGAIANDLAVVLSARGDPAGARPLLERALAIRERALGPDHPETAESLNNLAAAVQALGDLAAARALFERCLAICERVLGPDDPHTAAYLHNLAKLLQAQHELDAAGVLLERAAAIGERTWGTQHPSTAQYLSSLGSLRLAQGEPSVARCLGEQGLAILERLLGPDHPTTARSLQLLALTLREQGELAHARACLQRALAVFEGTLTADHHQVIETRRQLEEIQVDRSPS